jgi:hypothetical protein
MILALTFLLAFILLNRKHLALISELYYALDIGDYILLDFFVFDARHFIDVDFLMVIDVDHSIKIDVYMGFSQKIL